MAQRNGRFSFASLRVLDPATSISRDPNNTTVIRVGIKINAAIALGIFAQITPITIERESNHVCTMIVQQEIFFSSQCMTRNEKVATYFLIGIRLHAVIS
jgi:hypothetical protein